MKFHEPAEMHAREIKDIKEKGSFYCLDEVSDDGKPYPKTIFGADDTMNDYRSLNINFTPCIPKQITV